MKKILYTLSFLTLFALTNHAQSLIGFKGGLNLSYLNIEGRESLISFHAGAFSQIPLSDHLFIQPEVLFSVKGTKLPEYFYPYDLNFTFYYISMPVLFGGKITDHLSLMAGPELSYLVDANLEIQSQGEKGTEGFATWDFGLDLGAAYHVTKRIGIDLRFNLGLVHVVDIMFTDVNGQSLGGINKGKNRVIQLGAFYALASKK